MLEVAVPPQWKRQWDDLLVQLRDPFKLRITVVGAIAAVGLLAIYRPLSAEITILRRDLKVAEDRLALIREIDALRKVRGKFLENLPADGDINFWSAHLLTGIRESGVNLKTLDSSYRKTKVGKLQGVYYDLEVGGTFQQIHTLVSWIEANKYFSRVVNLRFKGEDEGIHGKLTIAVLVAPEKSKAAKPGTYAKDGAKTGAEKQAGASKGGAADESAAPDARHGATPRTLGAESAKEPVPEKSAPASPSKDRTAVKEAAHGG